MVAILVLSNVNVCITEVNKLYVTCHAILVIFNESKIKLLPPLSGIQLTRKPFGTYLSRCFILKLFMAHSNIQIVDCPVPKVLTDFHFYWVKFCCCCWQIKKSIPPFNYQLTSRLFMASQKRSNSQLLLVYFVTKFPHLKKIFFKIE